MAVLHNKDVSGSLCESVNLIAILAESCDRHWGELGRALESYRSSQLLALDRKSIICPEIKLLATPVLWDRRLAKNVSEVFLDESFREVLQKAKIGHVKSSLKVDLGELIDIPWPDVTWIAWVEVGNMSRRP
jgi:hypothetical protein